MAAATVATGSASQDVYGNKRVSIATLTNPADTNTWDSGLRRVDAVFTQINESSASASDGVTATVSGGTVTLGVTGTVTSLFIMAIGN